MSIPIHPAISRSDLPGVDRVASGKVRDIYRVDPRHLLIVATDRISAFDCILPNPIPGKGEVLTRMSVFWFEFLRDIVASHFVSAAIADFPENLQRFGDRLAGRSMLVRSAEMIPVECVARGYLAGSGWKEYRATGAVCGIPIPAGLREGDRLPEAIFTPATKAQSGHDENVSFERVCEQLGEATAERLRSLTLQIYQRASAYAAGRGILIADTKFEFGLIDGSLALCDEVLTPDSSRFWPAADWSPGRPQASYDKQFVRDYLETLDWDKQPPAPELPPHIIERTSVKYREAYRALTGRDL